MSVAALTANALDSGDVVFWNAGRWVEAFAEAELFEADPAADGRDAALAAARDQTRTVIDPYLIEVALEDGLPVPVSYRERVRALGPTIHPDMGKQAAGGAVVQAMQAAHGAARSSGRLGLIRLKR